MRGRILKPIAAFFPLLLAACIGQGGGQSLSEAAWTYSGLITAGTNDQAPEELRALIAAGAPQMALNIPDLGLNTMMLLAGSRDGVARWRSGDNVQIIARDGLIIATRGFGFDIMSTDAEGAADLILSGRGGRITRIHRMLDGEDRTAIRSWICDILPLGPEEVRLADQSRFSTRKVEETCHGPRGGFSNLYWVHDGALVQSRQFLGPETGYLRLQFLP